MVASVTVPTLVTCQRRALAGRYETSYPAIGAEPGAEAVKVTRTTVADRAEAVTPVTGAGGSGEVFGVPLGARLGAGVVVAGVVIVGTVALADAGRADEPGALALGAPQEVADGAAYPI